jgi:hypothetical protein
VVSGLPRCCSWRCGARAARCGTTAHLGRRWRGCRLLGGCCCCCCRGGLAAAEEAGLDALALARDLPVGVQHALLRIAELEEVALALQEVQHRDQVQLGVALVVDQHVAERLVDLGAVQLLGDVLYLARHGRWRVLGGRGAGCDQRAAAGAPRLMGRRALRAAFWAGARVAQSRRPCTKTAPPHLLYTTRALADGSCPGSNTLLSRPEGPPPIAVTMNKPLIVSGIAVSALAGLLLGRWAAPPPDPVSRWRRA